MITHYAVVTRPGYCRWCRCTDARPSTTDACWMDQAHTLCSNCRALEEAMQTAKGRQALAEFLQAREFFLDVPRGTSQTSRTSRRSQT